MSRLVRDRPSEEDPMETIYWQVPWRTVSHLMPTSMDGEGDIKMSA